MNDDISSPRAQAAIALKVPQSGIPWLDDMITESWRMELIKSAAVATCGKMKSAGTSSPASSLDTVTLHELTVDAEEFVIEMLDFRKTSRNKA